MNRIISIICLTLAIYTIIGLVQLGYDYENIGYGLHPGLCLFGIVAMLGYMFVVVRLAGWIESSNTGLDDIEYVTHEQITGRKPIQTL